ncbi:sel1 repeat family protein [Rhodanobacter sp. B04]|uniref:tetratricopeptide repeat protein n=1 Tax=Rhodanobacter sp. B04 TaxID=1945860 RepID=UPI0011154D65|nr:sel1 repeat family protein [Rhodanobacter sp. B04]
MCLPHKVLATLAISTILAVLPVPAIAQLPDESLQAGLLNTTQIASSHPDLFYRDSAIRAYKTGDKQAAMRLLLKAASFADKPAQSMLAAMYWNGDGIPMDRPRGYAWMDLAADRGYPDLLANREKFWQQLDPQERQLAIAEGRKIYAYYDDKSGLKRLGNIFRRELASATGSRTGFGGNYLTILMRDGAAGRSLKTEDGAPMVLRGTQVRGTDYYSPVLWNPELYAKLKDHVWEDSLADMGTVEVGSLQSVPAPSTSKDK